MKDNATSMDAAFRAAVNIQGDGGTDAVNWNAAATLGSSVSSGDVNVVAETISVNGAIAADTGRAIDVSLTATDINGCQDTRIRPDYIRLDHPVADRRVCQSDRNRCGLWVG